MRTLAEIQKLVRYMLIGAMVMLFINAASAVMSTSGESFVGWFGKKLHDDKISPFVGQRVRPALVRSHVGSMDAEDVLAKDLRARVAGDPSATTNPEDFARVALESWAGLRSDVRGLWVVLTLMAVGLALGFAFYVVGLSLWPDCLCKWIAGAVLIAAGAAVLANRGAVSWKLASLAIVAFVAFHWIVRGVKILTDMMHSRELGNTFAAVILSLLMLAPATAGVYFYAKSADAPFAASLSTYLFVALGVLGFVVLLALAFAAPLCGCKKPRPGDNAAAPADACARPVDPVPFSLPAVWPLGVAIVGVFFQGYALGLLAALMTPFVQRNRWLNVFTFLVAMGAVVFWTYGLELWFGPGWSKSYPWARWFYRFDTTGGE